MIDDIDDIDQSYDDNMIYIDDMMLPDCNNCTFLTNCCTWLYYVPSNILRMKCNTPFSSISRVRVRVFPVVLRRVGVLCGPLIEETTRFYSEGEHVGHPALY